jgi:hypothetical protein
MSNTLPFVFVLFGISGVYSILAGTGWMGLMAFKRGKHFGLG